MKRFYLSKIAAIFLFGVSDLLVSSTSAQDPTVPRQPILGRVPDVSLCTVTFKYKDAAPPTQKGGASAQSTITRIVTVQTEKRGAVYRQITTMTDGAKKENWSVNGEQICKNVYSDSYIHVSAGNPLYVDFTTSDFGELVWVGLDNYIGVSKEEPKSFIFTVKNSERRQTAAEKEEYAAQSTVYQNSADGKLNATQRNAFLKKELDQYIQQKFGGTESRVNLDITSQLPITYDDGTIIRTYTYSDKVEPLSAPVGVMQAIRYWAALARTTKVRPSPP